jgi:protein SCO1/2
MLKMDQRCLLSTSASDTTSKHDSGKPETKSSEKNEKSGGSESSDGGSDHKNERASGKDVRGGVTVSMNKVSLIELQN